MKKGTKFDATAGLSLEEEEEGGSGRVRSWRKFWS